jgi:hypothetical protein
MTTLIVGDVHGCRAELEQLLELADFKTGDHLVLVGDTVARGPDSRGVLELARQKGASVVRGNHDAKLLAWRRGETVKMGAVHLEVARSLRDADWQVLEGSSLYLDLPEHDVRVVHAGVIPGIPIEEQKPETLLYVRTVRVDGHEVLWGEAYVGPPHVVFGHNAPQKLQIHPWATGLDTGCVYGGALTGLRLATNQRVPADRAQRMALLVSVPAARVYHDPHSKSD